VLEKGSKRGNGWGKEEKGIGSGYRNLLPISSPSKSFFLRSVGCDLLLSLSSSFVFAIVFAFLLQRSEKEERVIGSKRKRKEGEANIAPRK